MAKKVSTIDLNMASVQQLEDAKIPLISTDRAEELVAFRGENGPFRNWDEVEQVPGFTEAMVQNLRESGAMLGSIGNGEDDDDDEA